jgi:hypothetical protein
MKDKGQDCIDPEVAVVRVKVESESMCTPLVESSQEAFTVS